MKYTLGLIALLLAGMANAATESYNIDASHSFANFSIRHVVAKTSGSFNDIKGVVKIDRDNLANSSVEARINVLSISTGHAKRDEHIKKPEYLDAGAFAEIQFVSTSVKATSASEGVLTGKLTMHGITREISFPFKVLGFGTDPWGGYRTGIEAHTQLKASEFGFTWGAKNGPVGDDLDIILLIEGVKQ